MGLISAVFFSNSYAAVSPAGPAPMMMAILFRPFFIHRYYEPGLAYALARPSLRGVRGAHPKSFPILEMATRETCGNPAGFPEDSTDIPFPKTSAISLASCRTVTDSPPLTLYVETSLR